MFRVRRPRDWRGTAVTHGRTGAQVAREILPRIDIAIGIGATKVAWVLQDTVSGVLHRQTVCPLRGGREALLAKQVNPRTRVGIRKSALACGAAVSRLEPVIRACEATEDVRGWSPLVSRLFEHGGRRRARRVSIRGPRRKPGNVQAPGGVFADEDRKGCAEGSDWPKRAKRIATPTSRDSKPARTDWTEQAPAPNEDGGMPYRMTARSVVAPTH